MAKQGLTYKDAGVDIASGDACSALAYNACKQTFGNRKGRIGAPSVLPGGFSGPIYFGNLKDAYVVKNSDGVGSKVLLAQRLNTHDTVGFDLIAMVADDAAALGAEPVAATNTLDVKVAHVPLVRRLMKGLVNACNVARIAMVGGEIAELGGQVKGHGKYPYIWNADLIGVLEPKKMLSGARMRAGDAVVALKSNGMRSNGLSLARLVCRRALGKEWHRKKARGVRWGKTLLKPSRICTPLLVDAVGGYGRKGKVNMTGAAHITGGGVPGNMARVLKRKRLGARLDGLFKPQKEFLALQEMGGVSDREAYSTWNMGQCFLVTTREPDALIKLAKRHGIPAKVAGAVTKKRRIAVESKGREGAHLVF